jgi:hypothetical protein
LLEHGIIVITSSEYAAGIKVTRIRKKIVRTGTGLIIGVQKNMIFKSYLNLALVYL